MNNDRNRRITRRTVLKSAALLAAVVAAPAGIAEALAQTKASKAAMQYRDTPNGKQQCDNCIQFVPGKSPTAMGTCKIVEGDINPKGWCVAYAPKA